MKKLKYKTMALIELQKLQAKLMAGGAAPDVIKSVERKIRQTRRKIEGGYLFERKRRKRAACRKTGAVQQILNETMRVPPIWL